MERYNNIKAKYNEIEGEYERLKVVCKQKEKDMEGIKKVFFLIYFNKKFININLNLKNFS
jgi:hypothetical protein